MEKLFSARIIGCAVAGGKGNMVGITNIVGLEIGEVVFALEGGERRVLGIEFGGGSVEAGAFSAEGFVAAVKRKDDKKKRHNNR